MQELSERARPMGSSRSSAGSLLRSHQEIIHILQYQRRTVGEGVARFEAQWTAHHREQCRELPSQLDSHERRNVVIDPMVDSLKQ